MKPLSGLFKPIPFLIRYPIYHQKYYPAGNYSLQLRPFSIMEDISIIYTWINKPRLLCSGHIKNYQRNMLKYYKGILDSGDSQALMVTKDSLPICQISLFQASSVISNPGPPRNAPDVQLRFLADFRTPSALFQSCIHLCLDYLFSFTENPTRIYTSAGVRTYHRRRVYSHRMQIRRNILYRRGYGESVFL